MITTLASLLSQIYLHPERINEALETASRISAAAKHKKHQQTYKPAKQYQELITLHLPTKGCNQSLLWNRNRIDVSFANSYNLTNEQLNKLRSMCEYERKRIHQIWRGELINI